MKTFSQRKGYKPISEIVQIDSMSDELRISLWNRLTLQIWKADVYYNGTRYINLDYLLTKIWVDYLKKPLFIQPLQTNQKINSISEYFFSCKWYEVYDILEFIVQESTGDVFDLELELNNILEKELAGFRFVNGRLLDITNEEELSSIEQAAQDTTYTGVSKHIQKAIDLYSNRENPDFRNSIKESISAVESMVRIISGKKNATLGDAIKEIEKNGNLHPALKEGFLKLYGYTNDEDGIRHSMLDIPNLGSKEARYFLVTCSAFVNYLKETIQ